jgi:hypothetical protein
MADDKFDVDFDDVDFDEENEQDTAQEESTEEPVEKPKEEKKEKADVSSDDVSFSEDKEEPSTAVEEKKEEVEVVDDSNPIDNINTELSSSGVVTGEIGTKVSRYPIEKIRFTKAKKELISIMTGNVTIPKLHYHENTGSFLCFDGLCCDKLGFPKVRYLFPVVVYDTNKAGKPVSKDVEVKVLQLGKELYEDITTIKEMHGDITNIDLLVTCKDEQYQRVSFTPAGKARWRRSSEIKKEVYNFWKKNHKHMIRAVGRELTEKEFIEEMEINDINDSVSEDDFEDIFND